MFAEMTYFKYLADLEPVEVCMMIGTCMDTVLHNLQVSRACARSWAGGYRCFVQSRRAVRVLCMLSAHAMERSDRAMQLGLSDACFVPTCNPSASLPAAG